MRLSAPRITPIEMVEATPYQREVLAPLAKTMGPLNIFRTMARTPKALKRFNLWGSYILGHGTSLPPREREIAILRTGWLCRSGYEWVQHRRIGLECGLTEAEIAAIKEGPSAPTWSAADAAILAAVDDIVGDHFVSDETWARLAALGEEQRMDLVYTVGQYITVSTLLNSFGVQLDEGQVLDADFPA